jgi:hypothetical protein
MISPSLRHGANLKSATTGDRRHAPVGLWWVYNVGNHSRAIRYNSEAESLLRCLGAISDLKSMRYWSTTHERWQTRIVDAYALTGE